MLAQSQCKFAVPVLRKLLICIRFRWVKCQLDAIRPLKRPKIIREALETLQRTLDGTYERILLHLSNDAEDNLVLLRRILAFVTFAKRPMTVAELAQAVIVEIRRKKLDDDAAFYDPDDLLSLCRPLIDVSPSTGLLGFVHYSIQEFLLSRCEVMPHGNRSAVSHLLGF